MSDSSQPPASGDAASLDNARSRRSRAPARPQWRVLGNATLALRDERSTAGSSLRDSLMASELAPATVQNAAGLPSYVLCLPQVAGHVHDASCWVRPGATGGLPRDAWAYLVEALWQVCRRAGQPDALTSLTIRLENRHRRPDAITAWQWLGMAEQLDRKFIAAVPNGPEVVEAVRDALRRMAQDRAAAN
jgi:hypothetical protein